MKACRTCGENLPLDRFHRDANARDGLRNECKSCTAARRRAWYEANREREVARVTKWQAANPDRVRATQQAFRDSGKKRAANRKYHLKRTYGLTLEEYDRTLAEQGGGCAICGRPPREDSSLHVDHCHRTSAVRGILCFRCNNALGDLDHDVDLLRAAVAYLERAEVRQCRARAGALRPEAGAYPPAGR